MSVIAAFELHNELALGESAGEPDSRHRRFGSGADEADLLDCWKGLNHQSGEICFCRSGGPKAGAVARSLDDGLQDLGLGVAEDQRSPRANVVDVLVAISIPHVRAHPAHQKRRGAANGPESADRGIDSAGNELLGSFLQSAGLVKTAGHATSVKGLNTGVYQPGRQVVVRKITRGYVCGISTKRTIFVYTIIV